LVLDLPLHRPLVLDDLLDDHRLDDPLNDPLLEAFYSTASSTTRSSACRIYLRQGAKSLSSVTPSTPRSICVNRWARPL
ncbi:hypothetical protein HK405_000163, partial [Cladochytrium tenue]